MNTIIIFFIMVSIGFGTLLFVICRVTGFAGWLEKKLNW